jgi:hypothetical protein
VTFDPATSTQALKVSLASRPADIDTRDRLELDRGGTFGEIDGAPDRLLGSLDVGDVAALHAMAPRHARSRGSRCRGCGGAASRAAHAASAGR